MRLKLKRLKTKQPNLKNLKKKRKKKKLRTASPQRPLLLLPQPKSQKTSSVLS